MLNIYLAGEIHSDWRDEIIQLTKKNDLNVNFSSPVTDHDASDNCGVEILGNEETQFWNCLLYTSPSPRDQVVSRMPSSA